MPLNHEFIFLGAALVLLSIFAGTLSSRFGGPLLAVFLGLGILAGAEGPVGIDFRDFQATYLIGSMALAIILFDGGLRTRRDDFELAAWPALLLATIGVVIAALVVAPVAHYLLDFSWIAAFLIGAIVASTDAAAVFILLNVRGMEIQRRVRATLEVESGINDPMAVFLTFAAVLALRSGEGLAWDALAVDFVRQMVGGALIGLGGGYALVTLINGVELAAGLYPILAMAGALALFGGAQTIGVSGFLAVYLAGLIVGNRRHRAAQLINRFHDGLAWLCQIVLFLLLGLLARPSELLADMAPALAVAGVSIVLARPLAVAICLLPFRYTWREVAFVSWVGLRGAVPVFLATIPILAPVPEAMIFFTVAFVAVLTSLLIQGWTIAAAARFLGLELPPAAEASERIELETVGGIDRDIAGYRVADSALALGYAYDELPMPRRTRIVAVFRDGTVMDRANLARLAASDYVLTLAPPEQLSSLDRLFASRPIEFGRHSSDIFGEFVLDGQVLVGGVAAFYGFAIEPEEQTLRLGEFIARRLRHRVVVGDRLRCEQVEFVVQSMADNKVIAVGIELDPESSLRQRFAALRWFDRAIIGRWRR